MTRLRITPLTECELVARAVLGRRPIGWVMNATQRFVPDASDATAIDLRTLLDDAVAAGATVTSRACRRATADRNLDGIRDRNEQARSSRATSVRSRPLTGRRAMASGSASTAVSRVSAITTSHLVPRSRSRHNLDGILDRNASPGSSRAAADPLTPARVPPGKGIRIDVSHKLDGILDRTAPPSRPVGVRPPPAAPRTYRRSGRLTLRER
jgi:hypothetical protein